MSAVKGSGRLTSELDGPAALRRLKWIALLSALTFIILLELVRRAFYPYLSSFGGKVLMSAAVLTGCLFFFGALFGVLERMQGRLERRNRELLALHEAALNDLAVAEERLRIAQEMHDGLAQILASVNTKAQAVKEFLRGGRTEEATRHLDQLASAAREVYADVRESIIGLRCAALPGRSIAEALEEYVNTWKAHAGVDASLRIDGAPRLASNAQLQVLRIVQESLANVRKHADASRVEISLQQTAARFRMIVQDDGAGFNPSVLGRSELPRFGLSTMRERAESMGGSFHLDSAPGAGTRITVELPAPAAVNA